MRVVDIRSSTLSFDLKLSFSAILARGHAVTRPARVMEGPGGQCASLDAIHAPGHWSGPLRFVLEGPQESSSSRLLVDFELIWVGVLAFQPFLSLRGTFGAMEFPWLKCP